MIISERSSMTDGARSVIFRSKLSVAKNRLQSFEQAGCWVIRLTWVLHCGNSVNFYHRKCAWLLTKEFVPRSDIAVINHVRHKIKSVWGKKLKKIRFYFTSGLLYVTSSLLRFLVEPTLMLFCCCCRKQVRGNIFVMLTFVIKQRLPPFSPSFVDLQL